MEIPKPKINWLSILQFDSEEAKIAAMQRGRVASPLAILGGLLACTQEPKVISDPPPATHTESSSNPAPTE
jgi:hypothetical protein